MGAGGNAACAAGRLSRPRTASTTSLQFVRQLDGTNPSAIRAACILELLQVDTERGIELRHRARQHDRAPARMFLYDGEPVRLRKFLDRGDVVRLGAELLVELLAGETAAGIFSPRELLDMLRQRRGIVAAEQDADLQPLGRIGLADGFCPRQRLALAAFQWISLRWILSHVSTPVNGEHCPSP